MDCSRPLSRHSVLSWAPLNTERARLRRRPASSYLGGFRTPAQRPPLSHHCRRPEPFTEAAIEQDGWCQRFAERGQAGICSGSTGDALAYNLANFPLHTDFHVLMLNCSTALVSRISAEEASEL
jgi:hypothetical protein